MVELRPAEEMKDSGIEWVGSVPNDWNIVPIRSCFEEVTEKNKDGSVKNALKFTYGEIVPKTNFDADEDDYVADTIQNYYVVSPGTIMINGLNLNFDFITQRVGLVKTKGIITSAYVAVKPKDFNVTMPEYMNYLFKSYDARLAFHNLGGGVRKILNFGRLKSQKVCFPCISEQQSIVRFLDRKCSKIDEIIAEATASIEEYKELKQAVIFEAVTHGIHCCTRKYSGFSWIGDIPIHWKTAQLKRFASIQSGITLGKKYDNTCELIEVPYLRVANVQSEYIDLSDIALIKVLPGELEKYRLHSGELLMTEGGDRDKLGRGCIWNGEIDPCIHQNHVFALSVTKPDLFVEYLDFVTTSDVGRNYFDLTAKKTTNLASTNSTTIMSFHIPVPPLNEQKEIVEYLNRRKGQIDSLISEKQSLIDDLQAYKKSLIYEVVTGKRRVV